MPAVVLREVVERALDELAVLELAVPDHGRAHRLAVVHEPLRPLERLPDDAHARAVLLAAQHAALELGQRVVAVVDVGRVAELSFRLVGAHGLTDGQADGETGEHCQGKDGSSHGPVVRAPDEFSMRAGSAIHASVPVSRGEKPARPPWARAIAATIARPRPAPPPARASSARVKRSNARSAKPGGRPSPSSSTCSSTAPSRWPSGDPHGAVAVRRRVRHEVPDRLLEAQAVALEHEPVRHVHLHVVPRRSGTARRRRRAAPSPAPARSGAAACRGPSARARAGRRPGG